MTLNFYTLSVIYLVYSFLGWVAETVVATIRGGRFANRGAAAGPFCFIYGTTGVLLAVSFGDLRAEPVYLFFACMMAATVMEWITAKLLERLHRRKWWDYSGKKFNLNGYVCLKNHLVGKGCAEIFQNGQYVRGAWFRKDTDSRIVFVGPDGKEMPMQRGKTFIVVTNGVTEVAYR